MKRFKGESHKIVDLLETFEKNPKKGKAVGQVAGIVISCSPTSGFLEVNVTSFFFGETETVT